MTENKKDRDAKFKEACPESSQELEKIENGVNQAVFDVHDTKTQSGLKWRQKETNAIRVLLNNGWTLDKILIELRHNGMTEPTARRIIEDATC
jgi:hypothetical protein